MKKPTGSITRRQFIGAGLVTLFPRLGLGSTLSEPDVVVVGAGAAGLAAAHFLRKHGKTVVLVEASHRIGGRAYTSNDKFGVPFDEGAHWLHHGNQNPYHIFAKANAYDLDPVPEVYRLFSKSGEEVGSEEVAALWDAYDRLTRAIGRAGRGGKDIAAIEATSDVSGRWANTARFVEGPWGMGKDFDEFSTQDWWNSNDGTDYLCSQGFGTLVAHFGRDTAVSLNTEVTGIDWSGRKVAVHTQKGTIKPRAVIITVSTGVLANDQITFLPSLPVEKQESFHGISMGAYDHIALLFSQDIFGLGPDGYLLFEIGDDGRGFGTLTNASGSGLAYCDVGGDWARELQRENEAYKIDYALDQLKSMLGNRIERTFVKGTTTAWGLNPLTRGAYASAEPGSYKMRRILRQSVANKIFFAGEACHSSMWATVGGAHLSGVDAAWSVMDHLG